MTVATRSAYPKPVDKLLSDAMALSIHLGEVPSRNRLMKEFKIGAPKAIALREHLLETAQHGDPDPLTEPEVDAWDYAEPIGPDPAPGPVEPVPAAQDTGTPAEPAPLARTDGHPVPEPVAAPASKPTRRPPAWPVLLLALPAFVAIWSGWVELGRLTGFGEVHPLPGIAPGVKLDTAITLPIGVETYAAYALYVWLSGRAPTRARRFAQWSAIGSLVFGAAGQVAYHLMVADGMTAAPWQITTLVSCLPVAVLGMGAALAHLIHAEEGGR